MQREVLIGGNNEAQEKNSVAEQPLWEIMLEKIIIGLSGSHSCDRFSVVLGVHCGLLGVCGCTGFRLISSVERFYVLVSCQWICVSQVSLGTVGQVGLLKHSTMSREPTKLASRAQTLWHGQLKETISANMQLFSVAAFDANTVYYNI